MKALILDGSTKDDKILEMVSEKLESRLATKNWDVKTFVLRDMSIAPCLGCFGCWIKTPGVCIINDLGREVTKNATQSDLWVFLSSVIFGGYSPDLKKSVDRLLPVFVPIFSQYKGEIHHKWRSNIKPKFIAFGLSHLPYFKADQIFKHLAERNSINFHSPKHMSQILRNEQSEHDIDKVIDMTFSEMAI